MAPQLLQDKAPNPNLAFEALHSLVPTAPSSLTSLHAPVAQPQPGPASEFGFMLSVFYFSLARSLLSHPDGHSLLLSCPFQSVLYMAARVIIITLQTTSCPALTTSCHTCNKAQSPFQDLQDSQRASRCLPVYSHLLKPSPRSHASGTSIVTGPQTHHQAVFCFKAFYLLFLLLGIFFLWLLACCLLLILQVPP